MSPELIEAATGATRWQQSFDAPMTDVFRVQADVAERVARELGVALATGERRHLESRPTGDLGAYDLYLRGRYAWHQRTAAGLDQARRLLEQAVAADPAFAPAHAALADVFVVLPFWSDLAPDQTFPRARAAALEALRMDSTLASPWAVLGDYNAMYAWNWPEAERDLPAVPGARPEQRQHPPLVQRRLPPADGAAWTRRFGRRGAPASWTRSV